MLAAHPMPGCTLAHAHLTPAIVADIERQIGQGDFLPVAAETGGRCVLLVLQCAVPDAFIVICQALSRRRDAPSSSSSDAAAHPSGAISCVRKDDVVRFNDVLEGCVLTFILFHVRKGHARTALQDAIGTRLGAHWFALCATPTGADGDAALGLSIHISLTPPRTR